MQSSPLAVNYINFNKSNNQNQLILETMNKKNYYEALGLITSLADVHPKLSKYYKSPNILIGAIKDLGEQGVIKLAESLTNVEINVGKTTKQNLKK